VFIRIYPYNMHSSSGRAIADALDATRVREAGRYQPRSSHTIINWGNGRPPSWSLTKPRLILNLPAHIQLSSNKLHAYCALKEADINVPPFTTQPNKAAEWSSMGKRLFARTILKGHSGAGIIEVPRYTAREGLPSAPVYTEYLHKKQEYRLHVVGDEVIDIQAKRRKLSTPDSEVNWHIRSNANGFIFCRSRLTLPTGTKTLAVRAVKALNLDFGAVDIIIHEATPYILEVNSAPGLSPTTVASYAASLLTHIHERNSNA